MNSVTIALCVAGLTFAGGVIGLVLQRSLPERFTTGGPRDMIGAVVGLLTLLSALVTGLLIWTAYGVYSSQNFAVQNFAARVLQEDLAMADYGADATPGRAILHEGLARTLDQMWGVHSDSDFVSRNMQAAIDNLRTGQAYLDSLRPSTDSQKQALAAANQAHASVGQMRLQMALALTDPVSYPLLTIVIGWAVFLFCGFGLLSRANPMAFAALGVGAAAVATAVYLIVDLSEPYSGLFRTSSAPIEKVMKDVNNHEER
jgi:hypothetical protein